MNLIDVRENCTTDCEIGFVFDDTGDYICELDACIQIYSNDLDETVPLVGFYNTEKDNIVNFIKAVKAAAGITENLGL